MGYRAQVIRRYWQGWRLGLLKRGWKRIVPDYLYGRRPGVFVDTGRLSRPHLYRPLVVL